MGIRRLNAIDAFRGISIIYMIIAHTSQYWLRWEDMWIHSLLFLIVDVIGANAFIFLSGIGLSLSFQSNRDKLRKEKNIKFGMRTLWIFILAFLTNLITNLISGVIMIWLWHVLLTIAIGRFLCYPLQRFSPLLRILIGVLFFLLLDVIESALVGNNVLYYIFFNGRHLNTPFPFLGFFFIGSGIGDYLYSAVHDNKIEVSIVEKIFLKSLFLFGLSTFLLGIVTGWYYSEDQIAMSVMQMMARQEFIKLAGLPEFLTRNSTAWCFYSIGFEMMFLSLFLHIDNYRLNKENIIEQPNELASKKPISGIIMFGRYSLTIYITHAITYFLFPESLSFGQYLIALPITLIVIYTIIWAWVHKGGARLTFEWGIKESIEFLTKRWVKI